MSGRYEKDKDVQRQVDLMIANQPSIIREYALSLSQKSMITKFSYLDHVINFCSYLNKTYGLDFENKKDIKKMNYSHILNYMNYIKTHHPNGSIYNKSAYSCATEMYAIKNFCKFLRLCRYLSYNPCDEIEFPKDNKQHEIVSLTKEEIDIIKQNILEMKYEGIDFRKRDLCIIFLGITTGLRVSAISNIDLEDIDFNKKTITTIEKGNVERTVFLSDKMLDIIKEWLEDRKYIAEIYHIKTNALFITRNKGRIHVRTIRKLVERYTQNIDKKVTPHKLRSTAATNLYDITKDIYLVANVLGHKNIQNTMRYARVSDENKMYAADQLSTLI